MLFFFSSQVESLGGKRQLATPCSPPTSRKDCMPQSSMGSLPFQYFCGYWMPAWSCVPAVSVGGCSLPQIPAVTCAANGAVKPVKRRQKRVSTANPERKNTSRLTSESIYFGTTASRSWKRIMPYRNRSKGRKPLSGSSERKPWNEKSRFRTVRYLRRNL